MNFRCIELVSAIGFCHVDALLKVPELLLDILYGFLNELKCHIRLLAHALRNLIGYLRR